MGRRTVGRKIVIAVDGPAASGKGTLAKSLAAALGFAHLDTGAVYRAVGLAVISHGGDPAKPEDVLPLLPAIKKELGPALLSDPALRTGKAAEAAALVAVMPEVRAMVHHYQVDFTQNPPGNAPGAVLDGRDIGTVICPDADIKFFVTAAPEERARRRFEELKGKTPGLTFESVLEDINARDLRDTTRKISPLRAADDAVLLDTTHLDPAGALNAALATVREKLDGTEAPARRRPDAPAP